MATQIVSDLYTVAFFFFFKLLLLKIWVVIRSASSRLQINKTQFRHTLFGSIEDKYPATLYYSSENPAEECAVCLSEFKEGELVRRLSCKHLFHRECVPEWGNDEEEEEDGGGNYGFSSSCPLCRSQLAVAPPRPTGDYGSSDQWGISSCWFCWLRSDETRRWFQGRRRLLLASS